MASFFWLSFEPIQVKKIDPFPAIERLLRDPPCDCSWPVEHILTFIQNPSNYNNTLGIATMAVACAISAKASTITGTERLA